MSIIATAVRHLLAAGVTGEALVQAIADMESAQPKDATAEKRRAYDRERKRREKDIVSGGIPVESTECAETPSLSLPLSSPHTPQQTPTHTHPSNNTRARKGGCGKPDDVSPAVWEDFCGLRKVRRAPVTESVVTSIRAEAGKAGVTLEAALTECVARGWQSFKADWGNGATGKPAAPPGDYLANVPSRRPQTAGR